MDILDFPSGTSSHPPPDEVLGPRPSQTCGHERLRIGRFELDICSEGAATWLEGGDDVDPAVAMAALFGQFDLKSAIAGLRAPGPTVFVYRPDGRRGRQAMRELPAERWVEAAPGLWIARDEQHLLMCPSDPVLAANLLRRI